MSITSHSPAGKISRKEHLRTPKHPLHAYAKEHQEKELKVSIEKVFEASRKVSLVGRLINNDFMAGECLLPQDQEYLDKFKENNPTRTEWEAAFFKLCNEKNNLMKSLY